MMQQQQKDIFGVVTPWLRQKAGFLALSQQARWPGWQINYEKNPRDLVFDWLMYERAFVRLYVRACVYLQQQTNAPFFSMNYPQPKKYKDRQAADDRSPVRSSFR